MRRLLIGCQLLTANRESLGIEATLAQLGYISNAPVDGLECLGLAHQTQLFYDAYRMQFIQHF